MRELDELLTRFLDKKYADSSSDVQIAFEELLKLSDPELARLLLTPHRSQTEEINNIIDKIKN
tara:strand:- start:116 stop:304 length:189 start_codon:yes stop_codon:yes gene_type:complete